jgi:mono/diheme cytochrome c family protein
VLQTNVSVESMNCIVRQCVILALIAGRAIHADEITPTVDRSSISLIAQPFFNEHCIRCHGPSEMKADLRLDELDSDLTQAATFERWQSILERVQSGEMPPTNEPRPTAEQVAAFRKTTDGTNG